MNNGFDIFVVAGAGTWARDYVYDAASKSYRPLYSDVDPKKADQKMVHVNPTADNISFDYNDMIFIQQEQALTIMIIHWQPSLLMKIISFGRHIWQKVSLRFLQTL